MDNVSVEKTANPWKSPWNNPCVERRFLNLLPSIRPQDQH